MARLMWLSSAMNSYSLSLFKAVLSHLILQIFHEETSPTLLSHDFLHDFSLKYNFWLVVDLPL